MFLVSIVILSYNSEKTILETLESCKAQTYENIELVVSDDDSKDHSWEILNRWCKENANRFQNIVLRKNPINNGISANCNQAVGAATGDWIKILGADDILETDCIEKYVAKVKQGTEKWYQSKLSVIDEKSQDLGNRDTEEKYLVQLETLTCEQQYQCILRRDVKVTPTMFYEKETFMNVGGADERIRNIEDWGLKLRFLKAGYRMGYLPEYTVKYRINNSVSNSVDGQVYNISHLKNKMELKKVLIYPNISKTDYKYWISELKGRLQVFLVIYLAGNRKNRLSSLIRRYIK